MEENECSQEEKNDLLERKEKFEKDFEKIKK